MENKCDLDKDGVNITEHIENEIVMIKDRIKNHKKEKNDTCIRCDTSIYELEQQMYYLEKLINLYEKGI